MSIRISLSDIEWLKQTVSLSEFKHSIVSVIIQICVYTNVYTEW